jgi:hypothetical protein
MGAQWNIVGIDSVCVLGNANEDFTWTAGAEPPCAISNAVKLVMPIWKHLATNKLLYQQACRRDAATCLRLIHQVRTVGDTITIAKRRTLVTRKPHQVNPIDLPTYTVANMSCTKKRGCAVPQPPSCVMQQPPFWHIERMGNCIESG